MTVFGIQPGRSSGIIDLAELQELTITVAELKKFLELVQYQFDGGTATLEWNNTSEDGIKVKHTLGVVPTLVLVTGRKASERIYPAFETHERTTTEIGIFARNALETKVTGKLEIDWLAAAPL